MKRNRLIFYLFLLPALVMVACSKSPQAAPAMTAPGARLMVLQPSPYVHPVDLYSVYLDTVKLNASPIAYPGVFTYLKAPSGVRNLFCMLSGTWAAYTDFSLPQYFKPGGSYTLYSADNYSNTQDDSPAFVEDDLSAPGSGYSKVRMIQGAHYGNRLNWIIHGGDTLARGLGYRNQYSDTTSFRQLPAGDYLFDLSDYNAPYTFKASLQVTLEAGKIYTVFSSLLPVADTLHVSIGMQLITNK